MDKLVEVPKNTNSNPILLYDKEGLVGCHMASKLSLEKVVVYLTQGASLSGEKNIYPVRLTKKLPIIPKTKYDKQILLYKKDEMLLKLLPAFAKKALEDNSSVFLLIFLRDASDRLLEYISGVSERIKVIIVGDLMTGENVDSPAYEMLQEATRGRISISDPLSMIYPIGINDLLSALKFMESDATSADKVYYALPPHPVTKLTFTRILLKKNPLIQVNMHKNIPSIEPEFKLSSYASLLGADYDIEKSIPSTVLQIDKKSYSKKRKSNAKSTFLSKRTAQLGIMASLVLAVGFPILMGLIGSSFLMRTRSQVYDGELLKARSSAVAANTFFAISNKSMLGVEIFKYLGAGRQVNAIRNGIRGGERASGVVIDGIDGALALKRVYANESENPEKDFLLSMQYMRQVVLGVSALKAEGGIPKDYERYIKESEQVSGLFDGLYDVLPEILGMEGERRYLVLFQNNMELRPGGGFIGSFGVLKIKDGKILEFPIHDVYDADGQLDRHIEPPFQLRRYLGASHWFLRDSNFELDFTRNGAHAAFFFNAEMKDEADGVIAIDTNVLQLLLEATGPIKVAGYNETITSENFFHLTESYAQDNFFPGSNQKQNFLKAVSVSLFNRLFESKDVPYQKIIKVISESIKEKHMLFAHPQQSIQKVFDMRGGGSSLIDNRESKEGVLNDFLGINEANLGMNKVNYYIDRSISHEVNIKETGGVGEKVSIHYINKSKDRDKYGGDYKAYLRLILPKDAVLKTLQFDGVSQDMVPAVTDPSVFTALGYTPQSGLEVENTEVDGKEVYGFLINVPSGKKKIITINYEINFKFSKTGTLDYSLKLFKQPGTDSDSFAFSLKHPSSYKALGSTGDIRYTGTTASLLSNLTEDRVIQVRLGKR